MIPQLERSLLVSLILRLVKGGGGVPEVLQDLLNVRVSHCQNRSKLLCPNCGRNSMMFSLKEI